MIKGVMILIAVCTCGLALWHSSRQTSPQFLSTDPQLARTSHPGEALTSATKSPRRDARPVTPSNELVDAVAKGLRSSDSEQRKLALETLLPDLIRMDIRQAAALAASLPEWASAEEAMKGVLDTWTEKDAPAATEWCMSYVREEEKQPCLWYICTKAAPRNPALAMTLVEDHSIGENRDLKENVLHHWARRDFQAATKWVELQHDEELKDHLWNRISLSLAETNPGKAATLAVKHIASETIQEEAVISVLHQWILKDREAAADWVALFPEGVLRDRAEEEFKGTH